MIGRLILSYPDAAQRAGIFLVLALITLVIYQLGVSPAWIGHLLPATDAWLTENPALARLVGAVMIALIAAANWKALRQLSRRQQIAAVWLDGAVHFTTGEGERKAKNLARNPHCIVTTGYRDLKGLDMVVEGKAARVTTAPALRGLAEAYRRKYGWLFRYEVRDTGLYHQGTDDRILAYRLRAKKALGFGKGRKFSHTRWRL